MEDAPRIFDEYATDPDVTRYLIWRPHHDVSQTRDFLAECLLRWDAGREFSFVITLADDDRAAGMIACRMDGHRADAGYVLARRLWGRGLMTEALTAMGDWALSNPNTFRFWAVCDVDNAASARVMEKAGMMREGLLRRWMIHPNSSPDPRDCWSYSRCR